MCMPSQVSRGASPYIWLSRLNIQNRHIHIYKHAPSTYASFQLPLIERTSQPSAEPSSSLGLSWFGSCYKSTHTSRASLAFLGTQISQCPQRLLHSSEWSTRHTSRRKPHHELISPGQNPQSLTERNGITGQLALWGARVPVRWDVKDVSPQITVSLRQGEMVLTGSPSSTTAPVLVWRNVEGGSGTALAASP